MAESGFLFPTKYSAFSSKCTLSSAPFSPRTAPQFRGRASAAALPAEAAVLHAPQDGGGAPPCSGHSGLSGRSVVPVGPVVPNIPDIRLFRSFRAASVVKSSRSLPSVRRFRLHPSPAATPCPAPANPPPDRFDSRPPVPNFSTGPPCRPRRAKRRQRKYPAAEAPGISFVCDRGRFSPGRADRAGSSPAPSPHLRLPTAPLEATAARDSPQGTERIVRTPPSPEAAARAIRIRRYAFEPS